MAYQSNIPQASNRLSDSQADLLGNFQAIKQLIDVNHGTFGSASEGKHTKVTYPVQSPQPTFSAGDLGTYSFLNPTTGKNELYVHKIQNATTADVPLTASSLSTATPAQGSGGWTFLPSGMYWVTGSANGTGLTTVTLATPPPNQLLNIVVCPFGATTTYVNLEVRLVDILSRTQFRVFISINGVAALGGFSFSAMGY